MGISMRSQLVAGVATFTAATLAFAPSVVEPTPQSTPSPAAAARVVSVPVEFAAFAGPTTPVSTLARPTLLTDYLQRIVVPPSFAEPFPTPQFEDVIGGTSIDSTIKNVYNAVEPWVRYGFELAAYAVGFVPYVGWLAPQVIIFYDFGERIARSITFNTADFLGGNVSFVNGLVNVGIDTINSFIYLANDELAFFLPPLPPLPPIGPFALSEATALKVASTEQSTQPLADTEVVEAEAGSATQRTALVLDVPKAPKPTATPKPTETVQPTTAVEPTGTPEPTETPKPPTTTSVDGVQAQGEVRGGTPVSTPTTTASGTTTTTTTGMTTTTSTAGTTTPTGSAPAVTGTDPAPAAAPGPGSNETGPGDDADGNATQD